ncbi:MAG: hypothetical protein ACE14L_09215 [Terriglobales bacterium]
MRPHAAPVIAVFLLAGLCAAAVSLALAWWYLPLLFFLDGLVLFAFLAAAYAGSHAAGWLPRPPRRRCWEAALLLVLGYPGAELIGVLGALICEAILLATPTEWHSAHEPQLWIGLLAFWGTIAAAFCVSVAVMVMVDRWQTRTLLLLILAGVSTSLVALAVYIPRYHATEGFAAQYRELVLFGVLLPLGNTLYSVLAGYGLTRPAPRAEKAAAATAS